MDMDEIVGLHANLGTYIRNTFRLWWANDELMESCREISEHDLNNADDASAVIIGALRQELYQSHRLRVVQ